jgi:hypothetical protein
MLVSYTDSIANFSGTDTIKITLTNRANDTLKLSSLNYEDIHTVTHNIDLDKKLLGAEDYTFSIYHTPEYSSEDSTKVTIESNGGLLEVSVVLKNGIIQNIDQEFKDDITLYPNPAKDFIYISNTSYEGLSIYNMSGKLVLNKKDYFSDSRIDISALNMGIYFIRFKKEGSIISKKFLKQ